MMEEKNGFHEDASQEISPSASAAGGDIQSLIGPAIQQTVGQYHNLLRQGLEQEVRRIIHEFETATADIESSITKRIRSRMMDLVNDEVRRVFDDALSNAESSLIDPARDMGRNRKPPISYEQEPQPPRREQAPPIEQNPVIREEEPQRNPSAGDEGPDDGGGRVNSFWTSRDSSEAQDFFDLEPTLAQTQMPRNQDSNVQFVTRQPSSEPAAIPAEDEIYEGTVRLNVEANGHIRQVVHFVRELRQKPQLRLLRLVGNNREGVDILLGLREPLHLKKMLPQIAGVSIVSTSPGRSEPGHERLLMVRLTDENESYSPWADDGPMTATDRVVA